MVWVSGICRFLGVILCSNCSDKAHKYLPKTSSYNLRNHLKTKHLAEYTQACLEHGWSYLDPEVKVPTVGENCKTALPPFSPETLLEYLVRFVTADDQVSGALWPDSRVLIFAKSIRVVECPEFRDLCMLLRKSLTDKDIPRRDKLREGIIKQFKKQFACLKIDLSVSLIPNLTILVLIRLFAGLPGSFQSHCWHLVKSESEVILGRHSTLDGT